MFFGFAIVKAKAKELFLDLKLEVNVNCLMLQCEKVSRIGGGYERTRVQTNVGWMVSYKKKQT